jgi:hypothetical protein
MADLVIQLAFRSTSPPFHWTEIAARRLRIESPRKLGTKQQLTTDLGELKMMGYGIAWLLGVPVTVLVIWYVVSHVL